jgi:cellulose biosynthesis protein BcsQ
LTSSLKDLGKKVLPPISQRIAVAEAVVHGLTVAEYAPDSPAHEEFRELARQVDKLLRK